MPAIGHNTSSTTNRIQDSGVAHNPAQPHSYSHDRPDRFYQTTSTGSYSHGYISSDADGWLPAHSFYQNLKLDVAPEQQIQTGYNPPPTFSDEPVEDSTTSSSNFAYDFLTPEYSSEYPYSIPSAQTTPSIDDLLWEQNFTDTMAVDPKHTLLSTTFETSPSARNNGHQAPHTLPNPHDKRTSTTAASNSLLSPQLTSTPSPMEQHQAMHTSAPIDFRSRTSAPEQVQEALRPSKPGLQVKALHTPTRSGSSSNISLQGSPLEPIARTASPIVMVSSYERGDSPTRSRLDLGRSSSKRSRGSRSSGLLAPNDGDSSEEEPSTHPRPVNENPSQIVRANDGEWLARATSGHLGIEPEMRGSEYVPSPNKTEEMRLVQEKNAEVQTWLAKSEAGSEMGDDEGSTRRLKRNKSQARRTRAHSTNTHNNALGLGIVDDSNLPGPGVLVDEDSEDEAEDSSSEPGTDSPPADVANDSPPSGSCEFPPLEEILPEQQEPLPGQFYRARPWQDPVDGNVFTGTKNQPSTSNAAIAKYDQQAAIFETASRAATWGTRRRLSETDIISIIGDGNKLQQMSLTDQKNRERRSSFMNKARGLVPRRSSSNIKKRTAETAVDFTNIQPVHKQRGESLGSIKPIQRNPSFGRSKKSPPLDTGSALMAMTGQLAAVGQSTSATPKSAAATSGTWKPLKRQRSKSDLPRTSGKLSAKPGLAELMSHYGGPPMPTLASPMQERPMAEKRSDDDDEVDEDDDGMSPEEGVKMDFKIRVENIVPTFEGFKTHAHQLNPRLEPFLIDRIGQEQLRRYKKLVENKVKHAQAVHGTKKCSSGKHCFELGGEATLLPPRTSAKDPETVYAQFQVAGNEDSENDGTAFADGVVNAALFPLGIPLPPVKRLPAEFECSLCFKVKKFQKPSDWTKHVHEDVQPFTCTFAHCTEPKSFKRKADWVRHENERHRHLEWWRCNIPDCSHICYRKDNFVQHLVREHKKPEPKVKSRGSGSSKAKPAYEEGWRTRIQEEPPDEVWQLVDTCRFETRQKPRDEACKFCGNVCNSWKKLTVHLAKHMEQIAMPVLELVRQREVSPDTIISPIEQGGQRPYITPMSPHMVTKVEPHSLSPYAMNAAPQYQGVRNSHSPVDLQDYYQPSHVQDQQQFHIDRSFNATPHFQPREMAEFARVHGLPDNMSYGPYQGAHQPHSFTSTTNSTTVTYPPPYNAVRREPLQISPHIPRSYPIQQGLGSIPMDNLQSDEYAQQQAQPLYSSPTEAVNYNARVDPQMSHNQGVPHFPMNSVPDGNGVQAAMPVPHDQIYEARPAMAYASVQSQASEAHGYVYQQ